MFNDDDVELLSAIMVAITEPSTDHIMFLSTIYAKWHFLNEAEHITCMAEYTKYHNVAMGYFEITRQIIRAGLEHYTAEVARVWFAGGSIQQ